MLLLRLTSITSLVIFLVTLPTCLIAQSASTKPNVILLIADDMNDFPGFIGGHPQASTPNLDRLAREGYIFENAFCSSPVCAASRASFLTGKDPGYTDQYNNRIKGPLGREFRRNFDSLFDNETVFTIPEILKDSGEYYTLAINKVFHGWTSNFYNNDFDTITTDRCSKELSWNQFYDWEIANEPELAGYPVFGQGTPKNVYGAISNTKEKLMMDKLATDSAINFIINYANDPSRFCDRPFFMALGHRRPHGPLFVPEKYFLPDFHSVWNFDLPYDYPFNDPPNAWPPNGVVLQPQPETGDGSDIDSLPLVARRIALVGGQDEAYDDYYDMISPTPVINPSFDSSARKEVFGKAKRAGMLMSYLAAIRFYDSQIGRLVKVLDANPAIRDNTVIVFISDHGFSMGEKKHWGKFTPWETEMRVPMFVWDPRKPGGKTIKSQVSLVDLFPSILELTGIEEPTFDDGSKYLDGKSFVPLIDDETVPNIPVLLSMQTEESDDYASCYVQYSVRDEQYRYIKFQTNGTFDCIPGTDSTFELLYDLGRNRERDPNEWANLGDASSAEFIKRGLREYLPGGALYNQSEFSVEIAYDSLPCRPSAGTVITLFANTSHPALPFVYKWTRNDGSEVTGPTLSFTTSGGVSRAGVLLEMFDTTGALIASDRLVIQLDFDAAPSPFFTAVNTGGPTYDITNFKIEPGLQKAYFDYGDGFIVESLNPYQHIYTDTGNYTISSRIYFGNDLNNLCILNHDTTINIPESAFLLKCGAVQNVNFNNGPGRLDLAWSPVFHANSYEVRLFKTAEIDGPFVVGTTFSTNILISDLEENTDYTWRVKAYCDLGISDWSYDFRAVTTRCSKPVEISAKQIGAKIRLNWPTMYFADNGYQLLVNKAGTVILDTFLAADQSSIMLEALEVGFYQGELFSLCNELETSVPYRSFENEKVLFELKGKFPTSEPDDSIDGMTLRASPNPSEGIVELNWENAAPGDLIRIMDSSGRLISEHLIRDVKSQWTVNLTGYSTGIYLASVVGKNVKSIIYLQAGN
jgi:arylsulfatase A-like enzyme